MTQGHTGPPGRDGAAGGRSTPSRHPLAYRDFRVLLLSTALSSTGFRAQVVVLGWLILETTDSAFMVGLGIGVLMAPNAIFGLLGGAVVDRYDRRRVLLIGALALCINSAALAALASGETNVPALLALTFLAGSLWSVQQTARLSYTFDIVGPAAAVRGLSLSTLAQRIGGITGGLGAGAALSQYGAAEAYVATAACFLIAGLVIVFARSEGDQAPLARRSVLANLGEYMHELRHNRTLATLIGLTAAVEVLGFSHLSALPILARDVLDGDGGTLGLLTAVASAGGIAGILLFSASGDRIPRGPAFLAVLLVFGLSLVFLGLSGTLPLAIVTLLAVSSLAALSDVLSQSLVQFAVPNEMRGRAMGSWTLAIGMAPIGHLQIGALAGAIGVSAALIANGAGLLLLATAAAAGVSRLRRL